MSCNCTDPEEHKRRCETWRNKPRLTPEYADYLHEQRKDKEIEDECEVSKTADISK